MGEIQWRHGVKLLSHRYDGEWLICRKFKRQQPDTGARRFPQLGRFNGTGQRDHFPGHVLRKHECLQNNPSLLVPGKSGGASRGIAVAGHLCNFFGDFARQFRLRRYRLSHLALRNQGGVMSLTHEFTTGGC